MSESANKNMTKEENIKAARNAYMKEWRAKNKDKVKAAQEKYWEKKVNDIK